MSYRDQVTAKIKDAVNQWLDKLKKEKPELQLTRQWKIQFDNGFVPGHTSLPVVTSSKKGKHLIAEVGFIVPDNLEIDLDDLELSLMDEPFKQKKISKMSPSVDEPLGVLNDVIIGINNFLAEITFSSSPVVPVTPRGMQSTVKPMISNQVSQPIRAGGLKVNQGFGPASQSTIDDVKDRIKSSMMLPDWLKSINNMSVYNALLDKIAEGYLQYSKTSNVSIPDFLKLYEDYLTKEGKLYDYCKYKAQAVDLDESNGQCQEGYCSKKPFNKVCDQFIKKFGKK
jgi:hypothetical protein